MAVTSGENPDFSGGIFCFLKGAAEPCLLKHSVVLVFPHCVCHLVRLQALHNEKYPGSQTARRKASVRAVPSKDKAGRGELLNW